MSPSPLDLVSLFAALDSIPGLRCVLIGGLAVMVHGGTRMTEDADLAIAFDIDNRRKVVAALAPLNPRPLRYSGKTPFTWDEKSIRAPWTIFMTDAGRIDLIVRLPGIDSFDGLYERSLVFDAAGVAIRVAAIEDLIAIKTQADRDRDRDDVNQLRALQTIRAESS